MMIKFMAIVTCLWMTFPLAVSTAGAEPGLTETIVALPKSCQVLFQESGTKDFHKQCEMLDAHIAYLDQQLLKLCRNAGEDIRKTVDGVAGIYLHFPENHRNGPRYYHENEHDDSRYIGAHLGRYYSFLEYDSYRTEGKIEHWVRRPMTNDPGQRQDYSLPRRELDAPQAEYEVNWKSLTSRDEQYQGLYGELLTVLDRRTREVIASRTIYYYVIKDSIMDANRKGLLVPVHFQPYRFATCKNYHPGTDDSWIDKRPRDSYRFVSRILKPRTIDNVEAMKVFDLTRGTGLKRKECIGSIRLGPNITLTDLEVSRQDPYELLVSVKGSNDAILCDGLLHPAYRRWLEELQVRFYDGGTVSVYKLAQPILDANRIPRIEQTVSSTPMEHLPLDDLHAIVVYQGTAVSPQKYPLDTEQGFIDINVAGTGKPITAMLMSYEPVEWRVTVAPGAKLRSVIVRGYHRQTVSGVGESVPISILSYEDNRTPFNVHYVDNRDRYLDFIDETKQQFRQVPRTIQSFHTGKSFVIDGKTSLTFTDPVEAVPAGQVVWSSSYEATARFLGRTLLSPDRMTAMYGGTGAFTDCQATLPHSKGKWYAEFTILTADGNASANTWTDVGVKSTANRSTGLVPSEGEIAYGAKRLLKQRLVLRSGDVIGMAIDLERSTLYIHKNGEWVTGNPSMASGGISLKPNREYVAVVAVGSPEKKSSSDAWTANFGASVFRYSMPQGYQGYGLGK